MEFKFDLHERRLHIRTLVPAGHEPRVFAPDELFQFGIEEEYFLSDSDTFATPAETPDALFQVADSYATGRICREFLQAQIEVATEPHLSLDGARRELLRLRQSAATAAGEYGLSILACGTIFGADPEGSLRADHGRPANGWPS